MTAVARDGAGNTTTAAAATVTVTTTTSPGLTIDAVAFGDRSGGTSTKVRTGSFSTTQANELLLAFVAADDVSAGNTVTGVTGAGLTWVLVRRTNTQRGTSEIWRTFATGTLASVSVTATLAQAASSSVTVVSVAGADTSGTNGSGAIGATASASANSGAPIATLTTTRNSSWIFGVGNDWDRATARTLGTSQTLVHQYLATVGDTYWVQRRSTVTTLSGSVVAIDDAAPSGDQYNLTICEILAKP